MRNAGIVLLFVLASVGLVRSQDGCGCNDYDTPMWSLGQVETQVAPIALYPDPLLANVLDASTHTSAIVEASDYLNQPKATRGAPNPNWPASITALLPYPSVISMLDGQLSWATRLGNTFQAQPKTVHDAVNSIRQQAQAAGNLASNQYQNVTSDGGVFGITPVNAADCWVPYYDPGEIYYPGYAYAWRRGFVQGYYWQGRPMPYHPYAHPYHPAYNAAYSSAYTWGGYHPTYHQPPVNYGGMGLDRGFEGGFGGFRGGFGGRR